MQPFKLKGARLPGLPGLPPSQAACVAPRLSVSLWRSARRGSEELAREARPP